MGSDSEHSWGSSNSSIDVKVKKTTRYKLAIAGVSFFCGIFGLVFFIWGITSLSKTVEAGTCTCVSVEYNPGTCGSSSTSPTSPTPSPPSTSPTSSTHNAGEAASRVRQSVVARTPTRSTPRSSPSPPACQTPSCDVKVLFSTGEEANLQQVGTDSGDLPEKCPASCVGQPEGFNCWKAGGDAYSSESAAKGAGAVPLVIGLIFLFCCSGWIAFFVYKLRKRAEKKAAKKEKKRMKKNQVHVESNPAPEQAPQTTTQPYPQQPGQAPPQGYAPAQPYPQQQPPPGYNPQQPPPPGYNPGQPPPMQQPYPQQQPPPGYNPQQPPPPGYNPAQGAPNAYQPVQPPPPGYQG